ncbi:MAG: glucose-6-phosphate isomerase, partial [Actinomycetota bacterium]
MNPVPKIPVAGRLAALDGEQVVERIWRGDHTVWKDDPTEIADRLGWLTVTDPMRERAGELEAFAHRAFDDGFATAVLLGMGGSSLAPEVFGRTFGTAPGALELLVLDTTHPAAVERVTGELPPATLFVVASKSGTTTETLSHLAHFWERSPDGARFVAITDPGTPLETLARERGFRSVFVNPENIGGRYSALSLFGLVPAALIGAPIRGLLDRAEEMRRAFGPSIPAGENESVVLGALIGEAARTGLDKLTLLLPQEIAGFGDWVEQLVAESTGKEGVGVVPVVEEPPGDPEVYGEDRLFVAVGAAGGADALERAGLPVARLPWRDREQLGGEMFRWE